MFGLSTSSSAFAAIITVMITVDVLALLVAGLKGRFGLMFMGALLSFGMFGPAGMGVLGPAVPFIGACRLARPRSYWARWFYDEEKMALARERFS